MSIQTKTMTVKSDTSLAETTTTIRDTVTFDVSSMPNGITYRGLKAVLSFADPIQWNRASTYDALTVVWDDASHGSYASKRPVPSDIELTNEFYWLRTADLDAQVEIYRQEVRELDKRVTANSQAIEKVYGKCTKHFLNVAEMKADATLKNGDIAVTANFYNSNGGGGIYEIGNYDSDGFAAIKCADNLTARIIPIGNTLSAKQLGAYGDGINDDTIAIQNLFDYCGKNNLACELDAGSFKITNTLFIKYSYQLIKGHGVSSELLKVFDGDLISNYQGLTVTDVEFNNFNLNGNSTNGSLVHTTRDTKANTRCGALTFDHMIFRRSLDCALNLEHCYVSTVYNCNIYNNNIGLNIIEGNGTVITDNEIYGNNKGVILDSGTFSCSISKNTCQEQKNGCIDLKACYATSIDSNYFENNSEYCIKLSKSGDYPHQTTIASNYIADVNPIVIEHSSATTISGNYFGEATKKNIEIGSGGSRTLISENQFVSGSGNIDNNNESTVFQPTNKTLVTGTPVNKVIDSGVPLNRKIINAYVKNRNGWCAAIGESSDVPNNYAIYIFDPVNNANPSGSYTVAVISSGI